MMKRSFVVLLLLAAGAMPVRAQGLELSSGVNFSTLSGDGIQNAANNLGMRFGVDFVLPLGPLGLNLGADWSQKGVEQQLGAVAGALDVSYLELPLHFRFPLVGAGPLRLNAILGPTLGINTGCKLTLDVGAAQDCGDAAEGFGINNIDWSGTAGLGVSFHVGGLAYLGLDLQYALGLSNVYESGAEAKNRTFTLQSHLGFDIF
jgi:hypothetical protein